MTVVPVIIMTLIGGYIFDMFGRKFTTFYLILLGGFSLVFFPIIAPNQHLLKFSVAVYSLMIAPLIISSPLIQDYVYPESMAKANAISLMGLSLGNVAASLAILNQVSKDMELKHAWGSLSTIMTLFALSSLYLITEVK